MADIVKGLREAIKDLLVPELKAVQVELIYIKEAQVETNKRFEAMQMDINKRFEEVHKRFEKIEEQIQSLIVGQREILAKLDLDKRLSKLEVLFEELRKQKVGV